MDRSTLMFWAASLDLLGLAGQGHATWGNGQLEALPQPMPMPATTSAVTFDSVIYLFGLNNIALEEDLADAVVRYDPTAESFTTLPERLPDGFSGVSAKVGGDVFLLGGWHNGNGNEIRRYSPGTGAVATMAPLMPRQHSAGAMAVVGSDIYLLGGSDGVAPRAEISRYRPASDSVQSMTALLGVPRSYAAGSYDGRHIYVFGGLQSDLTKTKQILRYDPATDMVQTMTASLPEGRMSMTACWDGEAFLLLGGTAGPPGQFKPVDQVLRYWPNNDTLVVLNQSLPSARGEMSSVAYNGRVYGFGGFQSVDFVYFDQVVRYSPPGTAPPPPPASGNRPPQAQFTVAVTGLRVEVDAAASSDPDGTITAYAWIWGDGSAAGSGRTANHTYAQPGNRTIQLTVTDGAGAIGARSKVVVMGASATTIRSAAPATSNVAPDATWEDPPSPPEGRADAPSVAFVVAILAMAARARRRRL